MIVSDIKSLIKERGELCRSEICALIDADNGLIDLALVQLAEKGVILEVIPQMHCKGCPMKCDARGEKMYRYV